MSCRKFELFVAARAAITRSLNKPILEFCVSIFSFHVIFQVRFDRNGLPHFRKPAIFKGRHVGFWHVPISSGCLYLKFIYIPAKVRLFDFTSHVIIECAGDIILPCLMSMKAFVYNGCGIEK